MLNAWEWTIIGIAGVVIVLWGPTKLPAFARTKSKRKTRGNTSRNRFLLFDGYRTENNDKKIF